MEAEEADGVRDKIIPETVSERYAVQSPDPQARRQQATMRSDAKLSLLAYHPPRTIRLNILISFRMP